jgi:hypothetical protein
MEDPAERPSLAPASQSASGRARAILGSACEWAWALLSVRALWPLPALLLLVVMLPFVPADAWQAQHTTRRTLSRVELALLITGAGCACYWLVLVLSGKGLLYSSRSWGMREPSDGELMLAEAGLPFLCLLMAYAGPVLLI